MLKYNITTTIMRVITITTKQQQQNEYENDTGPAT
jgi:hypothetical protein